jgi:hypothetical protein
MQGLPPEEPEEYAPLLPNSPEGPSLEESVNNDASYDIGSSTPLVEPSLHVNMLLNVTQDPVFLRINSFRDVVVEEYPRIPSGPFVESGVDEPPFPSEAFRSPVQTFGTFNPSSIPVHSLWRTPLGHDIFYKLGMSPNQPTSPHVPFTSIAYTVPPNHFTGTTSNIATISNPLLVGTHTILPSKFTSSTLIPQVSPFSVGSLVTIQSPIGTPLSSRPNPSLTSGYNSTSGFIPNPMHGLPRGPSFPPPPG